MNKKIHRGLYTKKLISTCILFCSGLVLIVGCSSALAVPADQLPPGGWAGIKWDHPNVSGWAKTATLSQVYIGGSNIYFPYDKACVWPQAANEPVVGNSWVILKYNGQWIASTWDYLRPCQNSKPTHAVGGGAIPSVPASWHPQHGEELYFFVSGLIRRADVVNVQERSNVVRYYWQGTSEQPPGGTPEPEPEPEPVPEPGPETPQIHTYNGTGEASLSVEGLGYTFTEPYSAPVHIEVSDDRSLRFIVEEYSFDAYVNDDGTFNGFVPIVTDICSAEVEVTGRLDGDTASGTGRGTGTCTVGEFEIPIEATATATYQAVSPTTPDFNGQSKEDPGESPMMTPIYPLFLK